MSLCYGATSYFTIGESILSPKDIVQNAVKHGYDSVALIDTMTLSGMVDFFKAAKDEEVKPIIGVRLNVVDDISVRDKKAKQLIFQPKLIVKTEEGLKTLFQIMSFAFEEPNRFHIPRLSWTDLLKMNSAGLIFTTGDFNGMLRHKDASNLVDQFAEKFGDDFYIEAPISDSPLSFRLVNLALRHAGRLSSTPKINRDSATSLLAMRPMLYELHTQADSLDVYKLISKNDKVSSPFAQKRFSRTYQFESEPHLKRRYLNREFLTKVKANGKTVTSRELSLVKQFNAGMMALSDSVTYEWAKMPISLPEMAKDEYKQIVQLVTAGWKERILKPVLGYMPDKSLHPAYVERLKKELSVLKKMNFCGYFLVVEDLVAYAKGNDITVGPGRGSAGGSLVSFLLNITDTDPIRFGLLFERFINPERMDLPDVDLDFASEKRMMVIDYLKELHGEEYVAGIANYNTLNSASSLRDVGRVFELPDSELRCSKLVPKEHGVSCTLEEAADQVPELHKFREQHAELWNHSVTLSGVIRGLGKHAAGIVVAGDKIQNRGVVEFRNGERIVNWDKRSVEDWGLVKIDILGLSTLDILNKAISYVKKYDGVDLNLLDVSLDDPEILEAFSTGRTAGIFQFESSGMQRLLKDLSTGSDLTFEDIAAATALYRPGPMDSGTMDEYVKVKQGLINVSVPHELLEPALMETNGVMIYQEQIMRAAQDLAGFTLAEADHLRKAMGKKDKDKMSKMREQWVDGCLANNFPKDSAEEYFDKIQAFAGYAFNKSHAVEYSIISYWAMYLKVKHFASFYAATLAVTVNSPTADQKVPRLIMEIEKQDWKVAIPDVNLSTMDFEIDVKNKRFVAPFQCVKGLSSKTSKAIVELREKCDSFAGIDEFREKIVEHGVRAAINKTRVGALEAIGTFDELDGIDDIDRTVARAKLFPDLLNQVANIDRYIDLTDRDRKQLNAINKQVSICAACDLCDFEHVKARRGDAPKFVVVTDSPNMPEANSGLMMCRGSNYMHEALLNSGLEINDGYFTALVKSPKDGKVLKSSQISACSKYLDEEISIIKPTLIVVLGSATLRHFVPSTKGGWADSFGKVIYDEKLDANILVGFNPSMIAFDPDKQTMLNDIFARVADITL